VRQIHPGWKIPDADRAFRKKQGQPDTENLGHPSQPVYFAKTNELFVSDGYVNRRVYVADADSGKFKRMWGAYGHVPDDTARAIAL
jgi:hypothetical protein